MNPIPFTVAVEEAIRRIPPQIKTPTNRLRSFAMGLMELMPSDRPDLRIAIVELLEISN